eukprot:9175809-Alexandrium_andersonii.AAC.1
MFRSSISLRASVPVFGCLRAAVRACADVWPIMLGSQAATLSMFKCALCVPRLPVASGSFGCLSVVVR